MNAVIKTTTWGLTATAAAAIMLSMNAFVQTAPTTPPAGTPPAAAPKATTPPPAAKAPAVDAKTAVPAAGTAAKKPADPAKKAAAPPSPCAGLDQAACTAKGAECGWIVPKKVDAKTGKADAPYCRKVAGVAKKAVDAKAAAPAAKPAAAPAAPKPAATTAPAAPGATPAPAAPKKP